MMTDSPLLSVRDVGIAFGGIRALAQVSLDVPEGSIVSVIGPNGAGKTTLFNCLTGIYRPDSGSARFAEREILGLRPDQIAQLGLARTFQNIELFARMTVLDNIMLGRHRHMHTGPLSALGFGRRTRDEEVAQRRIAEQVLDFLDLHFARERFVAHLPYGVRKKVELARALALEPRLLLLDEPSAGMNAEEKEDLVHLVRDIREEMRIAVVLVEHVMGLVMGISDRVVVLDHGDKIAEGSPEEVTADPVVIGAYLGTEEIAQTALGQTLRGPSTGGATAPGDAEA